MIKNNKFLAVYFLLAVGFAHSTHAEIEPPADPTQTFGDVFQPGGMPATSINDDDDPVGLKAPREKGKVVGHLTTSTQWIADRTSSILYLSLQRGILESSVLTINRYNTDYKAREFYFPSLDFFARLASLGRVDGNHWTRHFSLWTRYSLGFSARNGSLINNASGNSYTKENTALLTLASRFGLYLALDRWSWVKPYAGAEISPYAFRHTASLSGAEAQGAGSQWGPAAGAHFAVPYLKSGGVFAEWRRTLNLDKRHIYGAGHLFGVGLGLRF